MCGRSFHVYLREFQGSIINLKKIQSRLRGQLLPEPLTSPFASNCVSCEQLGPKFIDLESLHTFEKISGFGKVLTR